MFNLGEELIDLVADRLVDVDLILKVETAISCLINGEAIALLDRVRDEPALEDHRIVCAKGNIYRKFSRKLRFLIL